MSSNQQDAAQGSTNEVSNPTISSSNNTNNPNSSHENNENEVNASTGSNRSLNNSSRTLLWRINRDMILNNVSSMSHSLSDVKKKDTMKKKSIHKLDIRVFPEANLLNL